MATCISGSPRKLRPMRARIVTNPHLARCTINTFEFDSGSGQLYRDSVLRADQGCDFEFAAAPTSGGVERKMLSPAWGTLPACDARRRRREFRRRRLPDYSASSPLMAVVEQLLHIGLVEAD